MIRMVHGNLDWSLSSGVIAVKSEFAHPTSVISLRAAMGNSVPPKLDPIATMPNANPFLRLNQCATTPRRGPKMMPLPSYKTSVRSTALRNMVLTPTAKPWQRRNCQYSLHSATRNVATTRNALARARGILNRPMSNNRPVIKPGMNTSEYCTNISGRHGGVQINTHLYGTDPCSTCLVSQIFNRRLH